MSTSDYALIVSLISLLVSLGGFVWNVWSKFIYPKARVEVTFSVVTIYGEPPNPTLLCLAATNFGPSEVILHATFARDLKSFRRRPTKLGMLNPLHDFPLRTDRTIGPFSGGLPKKLIGETFSVYFPLDAEFMLIDEMKLVGFSDTFRRFHWAPKKDLVDARNERLKFYSAKAKEG